MTRRELFEKIQSGEPLDARESLFLEQNLESSESYAVAGLVQGLHDPEPSMAWRSELNEKLQAVAPAPKVEKRSWFGSGLIALGAAVCGFALFVVFNPSQQPVQVTQNEVQPPVVEREIQEPSSLNTKLIQAHLVDEAEVSGGVMAPRPVADSGYDWSSL